MDMSAANLDSTHRAQAWQTSSVRSVKRWLPAAIVAVVAVTSLNRTGVALGDIARFAGYWMIAVLAPGMIISRVLLGIRRNWVEDIAVGAATGLALEVLAWVVGVALHLGPVARFWWLPVVAIGIATPALRRLWWGPVGGQISKLYAAGLASVVSVGLIRLAVTNFRTTALPPNGGTTYQDLWWHLSLVQEVSRYQRPQVPQVAGEPLVYHFFSHIHMASAPKLSGVRPEVVLLRLWIVPILALSVCLIAAVTHFLTRRGSLATLAGFLAFGAVSQSYLWPGRAMFGGNPVYFSSPSQAFANQAVVAAVFGVALVIRRGSTWKRLLWLGLILLGGSGTKSTVLPELIGGTGLALAIALITRAHTRAFFASVLGALLVVQAGIFAFAAGTDGGNVVLLGSVRGLSPYKELIRDQGVRGTSTGLLLDSITGPRALLVALLVVGVVVAMQGPKWAGSLRALTRRGRADPLTWWLLGALVAGYTATFSIDHSGLGQLYFLVTAGPFGIVLAMLALDDGLSGLPKHEAARFLTCSIGFGAVAAFCIEYFVAARTRVGSYGALDQVLFPLLLATAFGVAGWFAWRRWAPWRGRSEYAIAALVAVSIGVAVPSEVAARTQSLYRWVHQDSYLDSTTRPDYVSSKELAAMVWLRTHSSADEVLATNLHCRAFIRIERYCDSRSFWITGMTGRRAFLESWGYTPQSQSMQGKDGRAWLLHPSAFPARLKVNDAVFNEGDQAAFDELVRLDHVRWLVAVASVGPNKLDRLSGVKQVLDNGEVQIYRVTER